MEIPVVQNYVLIEIERGDWLPEITGEFKKAGSLHAEYFLMNYDFTVSLCNLCLDVTVAKSHLQYVQECV